MVVADPSAPKAEAHSNQITNDCTKLNLNLYNYAPIVEAKPGTPDQTVADGYVKWVWNGSKQSTAPTFDATRYSLTDPTSPWVIVNKLNPLQPVDYAPELRVVNVPYVYEPRMRPEAADAIERMFAAFTAETGLEMQSQSAYRSYQTQVGVYQGNDTLTARPGYSEHQTGWVMDISAKPLNCALQICFGQTPQGQWLAAHAYEYGFVIRYPDGKTDVTGYQYEPWHVRYVGVELATEMHDTGVSTLEEFFGWPPAPNYP